jgi:hypothetical protein
MGDFEIDSRKPSTFEVAVYRVVSQTLAEEPPHRSMISLQGSGLGSGQVACLALQEG